MSLETKGEKPTGDALTITPMTLWESCDSCPCNSGLCLVEGPGLPEGLTSGRGHSRHPVGL